MLLDACNRQDAGELGVIDPFWAAVWRASTGLDRFLSNFDLKGKRVLELGCGTGRAGIAAALRGAQTILTDGVSDPLLLTQLSVWRLEESTRVLRLRFAKDRLVASDGEPIRFPFIIGSDITYFRELWPILMVSVEEHLEADGLLILTDPFRLVVNEFLEWIDRTRYEVEVTRVPMDDDPFKPIRVVLIRLKRKVFQVGIDGFGPSHHSIVLSH